MSAAHWSHQLGDDQALLRPERRSPLPRVRSQASSAAHRRRRRDAQAHGLRWPHSVKKITIAGQIASALKASFAGLTADNKSRAAAAGKVDSTPAITPPSTTLPRSPKMGAAIHSVPRQLKAPAQGANCRAKEGQAQGCQRDSVTEEKHAGPVTSGCVLVEESLVVKFRFKKKKKNIYLLFILFLS
jgi:hypothetical protein